MIYTFIAGVNRSSDITWNSMNSNASLQERADTFNFAMFDNRPSIYDDIKVYNGTEIVTVGSNYVTVQDLYSFKSVFRVGDSIFVGINTSDEAKYTISSIDEDTNKITFSTSLSGISVGELIGHRVFGGNVIETIDNNLKILDNIIYEIKCVDYTKLFDKGQVVDTFADRTARYMINSICNDFINYNHLVDAFDYASDGDIQSAWTNGAGAQLPTTDSNSPYEKDHWGVFSIDTTAAAQWWQFSPSSSNVSVFTGSNSGLPTKGKIGFWIKTTNKANIQYFRIYIGNDASNRIYTDSLRIVDDVTSDSTPIYIELDLVNDFTNVDGTPDWTAFDYVVFDAKTTASTATVKIAGLRFLENEHFRHYPYVEDGPTFDAANINYLKPVSVIQKLAKESGYFWYIDYEKNIRFFAQTTNAAPFAINSSNDYFEDLSIKIDSKNLKNYQLILGGEDTSTSYTNEIKKGDNAKRDFSVGHKFADLSINLDNNTDTNAAEAGTTTTNIKITGHGLETGDCIVNRTRSNIAREITKVDANNFTVEAISGQTTGDTISFFSVAQTVGIEGIVDSTTVDYVYNSNGQSIRAGDNTTTLSDTDFIQVKYKERFPIITAAQNGPAISAIQSTLGYTDGIFRGKVMKEPNIKSSTEAQLLAGAEVEKYGNSIIEANFTTHVFGLQPGQEIVITDTTSGRNVNQAFMIQKVIATVEAGKYFKYKVMCSSVLYGIVEFFQQLLKATSEIEIDENAVPINLIQNAETITVSDIATSKSKNPQTESVGVGESVATTVVTPPFQYGPGGSPQGVYNLSEYG